MASTFRQYWDLTKPRVVALIVFTALVGMCLAIEGLPDGVQLLRGALGFLGIWLAASSAAAINQLLDARIDAKMARTSWRPLVQGQVKPWQALAFALVLAAKGINATPQQSLKEMAQTHGTDPHSLYDLIYEAFVPQQ